MPAFLRHLLAAIAICSAVAPVFGQRPPAWVSLHISGGVDAFALTQRGKLLVYDAGNAVHVFSAFTRRWSTMGTSGGAQIRNANDWVLVQDGNSFAAFSSMRGRFETLDLSSNAFVVNPSNQGNDSILLVRDGSELYAFSGFVGTWTQRTVSPVASIAVQRHVAVIADGVLFAGMSAYSGEWVEQPALIPATSVGADGTVAFAENSALLWAFSAQTESWQGSPSLGVGATVEMDDDVIIWSKAAVCLGFGGPAASFATLNTGVPTRVQVDQKLAAVSVGNDTHFFSGVTGNWTSHSASSSVTLTTSAATALLEEFGQVHAYSGLLDTVSSLGISPISREVNWSVIAAEDGATSARYLFSAFTGMWREIPSAVLMPRTVFNGALIQTSSGFEGYSARTENQVALSTTPLAFAHLASQSAIIAIEEPQAIHVFDPRRDAWLSQSTQGGSLQVGIWRTSLYAVEGQRGYGFGAQNGEIEVFDLPEPMLNARASSESVSVTTANHLVGYSPYPGVSPLSQFPEFRRIYTKGSTVRLHMTGESGGFGAIVLGLPSSSSVMTGVGTVYLEPVGMALLWAGALSAEGLHVQELLIPAVPVLSGLQLGFQGAATTSGGVDYFSAMSALQIR